MAIGGGRPLLGAGPDLVAADSKECKLTSQSPSIAVELCVFFLLH